ncbi:MAG: glycoside hydrolase family 5 protein [Myxococcota bacterium]
MKGPRSESRVVRWVAVGVGVAGLASAGCGDGSVPPPTIETALALPPLHAEPDPEEGGRIVDSEGREVLLRGVNVNAFVEYWQGSDFPTTFPFTPEDADMMAAIGWNAVRLLLSWSRVEPEPGVYDEAYLDEVAEAVEVLAARGIYSIIDMHQDAWSATLAARPDEVCEEGTPAFGWDGAPAWATLDGGEPRCFSGSRELNPAVRAAFAAFWENAAGPGGVGIRTRYADMWRHVAARFASIEGVAGYDMMNEPNAFDTDAQEQLSAMHAEVLDAIREGEAEAGAEARLVLFEPSALWSTLGMGAPPDFDRDRDVVYAPHIYTGGFTGGAIGADAFEVAVTEARRFGGAPVLSGEWGTGPDRADDPEDGYFIDHQDLQDRYHVSATLWTWRESCGDPHKAPDFESGTVWGEFEVDCATNTVTGVRDALVAQLTRAYLRVAPGPLGSLAYADDTGVFTADAPTAERNALLVAFYPASKHGSPDVRTEGLKDVTLLDAPDGNLYVAAHAEGGPWSLEANPP